MHQASLHDLSDEKVQSIRELLLTWFSQNARNLPWRIPAVSYEGSLYNDYVDRLYRCLLSETMLQQTQVKTVIAYYNRWLEKFPTLEELAVANEEDVMACWAGLGYYSRAKRLQQAAQYLVTNFVSKELKFPTNAEHWVKGVPGVGPYTAGAILSISFGIPSAIVDGNVQRVLSRVLAVHGDTATPKSAGSKLTWQRAAQLVQGKEPGNLNQSLMELGATICTPTQPDCSACPISEHCIAYQQLRKLKATSKVNPWTKKQAVARTETSIEDMEDMCEICPSEIDTSVLSEPIGTYIQTYYPYKAPKKKQREESAVVLVIRNDENEVYVEKKAKGLLAGLYDFPTVLLENTEADCSQLVIDKHKQKMGAKEMGSSLHLFTHIRRTSHVLQCRHDRAAKALQACAAANSTGKWVPETSLADIGVSELCLKNWRLITKLSKPEKHESESIVKEARAKRTKITAENRPSSKAYENSNSKTVKLRQQSLLTVLRGARASPL